MINPNDTTLSISEQCELIDIPRSSYYYQEVSISELNLRLMHRMDELYTEHPFLGAPQFLKILRREEYPLPINIKRIKRLMRIMGIKAIYPEPKTTWRNKEHQVYPYLLKKFVIDHPNQVWAADITYIRMAKGFAFLIAIMDWHSRYVIAWDISNTQDQHFCSSTLLESLQTEQPDIFNTDQGSQFTSNEFTSILHGYGVQISMDGKGRAIDNIFVERLWKTVKYENIYIKRYETMQDLYQGLTAYFDFYNHFRPHSSLNDRTPAEIYHGKEVFSYK